MLESQTRILKRRPIAVLAAAASSAAGLGQLLTPGGATAATITWANVGITWSAGANWIGGVAPANAATTDAAVFQGTPIAQPFLSAGRAVGALDFQSAGWDVSGATLTLGTGLGAGQLSGINSTNNATGVVSFTNAALVLSATQTWTQSVDLVFSGPLEGNGTSATRTLTLNGTGLVTANGGFDIISPAGAVAARTFTIGGTGNMTINGVVKSTNGIGTFRQDSTGVVTLTNANTYTGGTIISAGILNINSDAALGTAPVAPSATNISVTGSSTLQIANGLGNVTIDGNRGVFIGGSASTSRNFTFDTGDNTVNFSGPLTDQQTGTTTLVTGNLVKQGSGTLVMSSVNSLTGTVNFAAGTLLIANPAALGNAGSLRWGGGALAAAAPLTVNNASVLSSNSMIAGSQTITFAGPLNFSGTSDRTERFSQDPGIVTQVDGGLLISTDAPRQFTIDGTGEVAINSPITETVGQAGTFRVIGSGTIGLNVANSYTGGTVLDSGAVTLKIGADGALSSGPIMWDNGTMRSGSARTIANTMTLGDGGNKLVAGADFNFTGPVTLAAAGLAAFGADAGATATLSGVVGESDGSGLSKIGAGTLIMSAANTYAGGTNVRNGWLVVSDDAQFGANGTSISFGSSGTLLASSGTLLSNNVITSREVQVFEDGGTIDTAGQFNTSAGITGPGTLAKQGNNFLIARHIRTGGLNVQAGIVELGFDGTDTGASNVGSLTIAGGPSAPTATWDLANNDAMFTATPQSEIQSLINFARNGGAWDRPGLTSSAAASSTPKNKTLGVLSGAEYTAVNSATFNGFTVNGSDVLVKFTYYGDTDFNGLVNFDDYSRTDAGFNNNRTGWLNGDFDGNGLVNFDDYSLIDLAFNTQSGTLVRAMSYLDGSDRSTQGMDAPSLQFVLEHFNAFGEGYAVSFLNAVPEPTGSLALSGLAAFAAGRRRRRAK